MWSLSPLVRIAAGDLFQHFSHSPKWGRIILGGRHVVCAIRLNIGGAARCLCNSSVPGRDRLESGAPPTTSSTTLALPPQDPFSGARWTATGEAVGTLEKATLTLHYISIVPLVQPCTGARIKNASWHKAPLKPSLLLPAALPTRWCGSDDFSLPGVIHPSPLRR